MRYEPGSPSGSSRFGRGCGPRSTTCMNETKERPPWVGGGRFKKSFSEQSPVQNLQHQTHPFGSSEKFEEEGLSLSPIKLDAVNTPVWSGGVGVDMAPRVTSLADVHFDPQLIQNIKRCNYVKPTSLQHYSIPVATAGRDQWICAPPSSGKTVSFCLPIIDGVLKERGKTPALHPTEGCTNLVAFILAPTRELSHQIPYEAKKLAYKTGVKIEVALKGAPFVQRICNVERGVNIIVATPECLIDMVEQARVSISILKFLALYEFDMMLDMGFEPLVRRIVRQLACVSQIMLFSATFSAEIQKLASDFLSSYIFLAAGKVGSSNYLIARMVHSASGMDMKSSLNIPDVDPVHSYSPNVSATSLLREKNAAPYFTKGTLLLVVIHQGAVYVAVDSRYSRVYSLVPYFCVQIGDYPWKARQLGNLQIITLSGDIAFAHKCIRFIKSFAVSRRASGLSMVLSEQAWQLVDFIREEYQTGRRKFDEASPTFIIAGFNDGTKRPVAYKVSVWGVFTIDEVAPGTGLYLHTNDAIGSVVANGYMIRRYSARMTHTDLIRLIKKTFCHAAVYDWGVGNTVSIYKIVSRACYIVCLRANIRELIRQKIYRLAGWRGDDL